MQNGYLTLKEAARRLGCARSTLYTHISRGTLTSVYIGRYQRIAESDLTKFEQVLRDGGRSSSNQRFLALERRLAAVEAQLKVTTRLLLDPTISVNVTDQDLANILKKMDDERALEKYSEEQALWWISTLPFLDEPAIGRLEAMRKDSWSSLLKLVNRVIGLLQAAEGSLNNEALIALLDEARRDFRASAVSYLAMSGRNLRAADVASSSLNLLSAFKARLAARR